MWVQKKRKLGWFLTYAGPGGSWLIPVMRAMQLDGLELRREFGAGAPIEFLRSMTWLKRLRITDWRLQQGDAMESLVHLEYLSLSTPKLRPISTRGFERLNSLNVEFMSSLKDLPVGNHLKKLFLHGYDGRGLGPITANTSLKNLDLRQTALEQIEDNDMWQMETLELRGAKKLKTLTGMKSWRKLSDAILDDVPELGNLEVFRELTDLTRLILEDCGPVKSFEPISQLPKLRQLHLIGNTRIMDGQVSALLNAPSLQEVSFPSRSSYDATERQLNDAIAKRRKSSPQRPAQ